MRFATAICFFYYGLYRSRWCCCSRIVWTPPLSPVWPICCDKKNHSCNQKKKLTVWTSPLEFSLNGAELSLNSGNSENLRNHWSMNWVQYKDLLCYLCLHGLVVSSLSLTQEILGSSPTLPFLYFINFFCHWIQRIQWKHLEKTPLIR